eukprot:TRINITY_DN664_c0_g1_i1.p1 TRINITY_DN664_c0_g1~~TRINITY_DN664_c0_g1_i1.p1  ORF type:complete len:284 (+),score=102.44 TRINITY_DN664_c0_g1_i1:53-853(+)
MFNSCFVTHGGGPSFFLDSFDAYGVGPKSPFTKGLRTMCKGVLPKLLIVVTAHWECHEPNTVFISSAAKPSLLFDYGGFPSHTYELTYPAPGAPLAAEKASEALRKAGIKSRLDSTRGLDHGVFIPLMMMYPKADIPVLAVSINAGADAGFHMKLGAALASVVEGEGGLLIASGSSIHGRMSLAEYKEYEQWLLGLVTTPDQKKRVAGFMGYKQAPHMKKAHPTPDHFVPLLVAVGMSEGAKQGAVAVDEPADLFFRGGRIQNFVF